MARLNLNKQIAVGWPEMMWYWSRQERNKSHHKLARHKSFTFCSRLNISRECKFISIESELSFAIIMTMSGQNRFNIQTLWWDKSYFPERCVGLEQNVIVSYIIAAGKYITQCEIRYRGVATNKYHTNLTYSPIQLDFPFYKYIAINITEQCMFPSKQRKQWKKAEKFSNF